MNRVDVAWQLCLEQGHKTYNYSSGAVGKRGGLQIHACKECRNGR